MTLIEELINRCRAIAKGIEDKTLQKPKYVTESVSTLPKEQTVNVTKRSNDVAKTNGTERGL